MNPSKVVSRRVGLTDRSRGEVHDLVSIIADVRVELGNAQVRPVATQCCKNVSKGVGLCNGSIDVGNDDGVGFVPEKDAGRAGSYTRVGRRDRKGDGIWAVLQFQGFLEEDL